MLFALQYVKWSRVKILARIEAGKKKADLYGVLQLPYLRFPNIVLRLMLHSTKSEFHWSPLLLS